MLQISIELLTYLILGTSSFFFVIVPVSGSFVLNPLLSLVLDPHTAISVAAFFFLLNSIVKTFVFRKYIQYEHVGRILPISSIAGFFGALFVSYIPTEILLITVLLFALYFLFKKLYEALVPKVSQKKSPTLLIHSMSSISGFMQGTGLGGGGGLRKLYLLSEGLTLSEMHGTTSLISVSLLVVSVGVRLATGQVDSATLMPLFYLLPLIVLANWLGRKILIKITNRYATFITIIVMIVSTILLSTKLFL